MPQYNRIHKNHRTSQKWSPAELLRYGKTLLRFLRIDDHSHFLRALAPKLKGRSNAQLFMLHARMLRLYGTADQIVLNLLRNYLGDIGQNMQVMRGDTGLMEQEKVLVWMLMVGDPLPLEYSHDMCDIMELGETSDEE